MDLALVPVVEKAEIKRVNKVFHRITEKIPNNLNNPGSFPRNVGCPADLKTCFYPFVINVSDSDVKKAPFCPEFTTNRKLLGKKPVSRAGPQFCK